MSAGTLWIVPTPVGNLADITLRALDVLRGCAVIACEDTRTTSVLLRHHGIGTPMLSYHKFNERQRAAQLIARLQRGDDVAVVSDAGTPGISDPAAILVREALDAGITVCALPGPTAFVPALAASGLPTERFYFAGFPPGKMGEREALLARLAPLPDTLIFYEAPHRLRVFLQELLTHLGDRRACLARELSKLFESYHRGLLSELLADDSPVVWKGEFVVLVEGAPVTQVDDATLTAMLRERLAAGDSQKDAVAAVCAGTGAPRNRVYGLALALRGEQR